MSIAQAEGVYPRLPYFQSKSNDASSSPREAQRQFSSCILDALPFAFFGNEFSASSWPLAGILQGFFALCSEPLQVFFSLTVSISAEVSVGRHVVRTVKNVCSPPLPALFRQLPQYRKGCQQRIVPGNRIVISISGHEKNKFSTPNDTILITPKNIFGGE